VRRLYGQTCLADMTLGSCDSSRTHNTRSRRSARAARRWCRASHAHRLDAQSQQSRQRRGRIRRERRRAPVAPRGVDFGVWVQTVVRTSAPSVRRQRRVGVVGGGFGRRRGVLRASRGPSERGAWMRLGRTCKNRTCKNNVSFHERASLWSATLRPDPRDGVTHGFPRYDAALDRRRRDAEARGFRSRRRPFPRRRR